MRGRDPRISGPQHLSTALRLLKSMGLEGQPPGRRVGTYTRIDVIDRLTRESRGVRDLLWDGGKWWVQNPAREVRT